MAGGLHRATRLVVWQRVVERDRPAEVLERGVELSTPVFDLAVEHGAGDGEDVVAGVVEQVARVGYARDGGEERVARGLGFLDPPGRRVRDALRVVGHRRRGAVEPWVGGQGE